MRVGVIGCGYVGAVTAGCLATLGHDVVGHDVDRALVASLGAGRSPLHEAGLDDVLERGRRAGCLRFSDAVTDAVRDAEVVFLCVGTPARQTGEPDLSQLRTAVTAMAPHLDRDAIVVTKSTVPVGMGDWVRARILDAMPQTPWRGAVVANPEFLREGTAVHDFLHPDRVVLGGEARDVAVVAELYRPILEGDAAPRVFVTDRTSAEMIKYAANAALATKISLANELAALCELTGADARTVLPAVGADRRIGEAFLQPGLGWGGSCLPKDLSALVAMGNDYGYEARLLAAARDVNGAQLEGAMAKIRGALKTLSGKRVALLGLAFKPDTADTRASPALALCGRLLEAGASVSAHDPVARPVLPPDVRSADDAYDAATGADALVVATAWPAFRELDARRLAQRMAGTFVLDPRGALDAEACARAGLHVVGAGWEAPAVTPLFGEPAEVGRRTA
jgi:UDPglucose 6-dehydrogenase